MDLDELKKIWSEYDQAIEPKLELKKQLLKEVSVKKVQSFLFEFRLENYLELFINGIAVFFLIKLLFANMNDILVSLSIAVIVIILSMEFVWNLYKLIQADKLSYKKPLFENLKVLEKLRLYNRWEINSLIVLIPVFSAAFIVFIPKVFFDLDIFPILGNGVWYFVLGSIVVGLVVAGALSLFPDKKMKRAINFLREISQYESEGSA